MPQRHMGKWSYSSIFLDLGTRRMWVVSITSWYLYPRGNRPCTHWIGGCLGPRVDLDTVEKRYSLPHCELNLGHPAHIPLLYWLLLIYCSQFNHIKELNIYSSRDSIMTTSCSWKWKFGNHRNGLSLLSLMTDIFLPHSISYRINQILREAINVW
jgi:hypothetical protein